MEKFYYPFNTLVSEYGFDTAVQNALILAANDDILSELELHSEFTNRTITLLSSTATKYQVSITSNYETKLILPVDVNWQGAPPTVSENQNSTSTYSHSEIGLFSDYELSDLTGKWVMHFDQFIEKDYNYTQRFEAQFAEVITIAGSSATTQNSKHQFNISLVQGTLILAQEGTIYKVTKLHRLKGKVIFTSL